MQSLSREQLDALRGAAQGSERDALMIALAVEHGLRATEVCTLRVQDFDASTSVVYLTVQRLKGSRRTRQPLLAATRTKVLAWIAGKSPADYLFPGKKPGQRITRVTFWRVFKRYCRATGIIPAHLSPHALKHTTAVLGLDGGMKINEVQRYLGHVSGASTLRYLSVGDDEASCSFRHAFSRADCAAVS
jgi:integrase/recombinase XerC